jgi:hypothetical protein
VRLIVVSAYAKPANISHTVYVFDSILKFIEKTFALGTIASGASIPYADAFSQTGDLLIVSTSNRSGEVRRQALPGRQTVTHRL